MEGVGEVESSARLDMALIASVVNQGPFTALLVAFA
jgi:hypothetical protein